MKITPFTEYQLGSDAHGIMHKINELVDAWNTLEYNREFMKGVNDLIKFYDSPKPETKHREVSEGDIIMGICNDPDCCPKPEACKHEWSTGTAKYQECRKCHTPQPPTEASWEKEFEDKFVDISSVGQFKTLYVRGNPVHVKEFISSLIAKNNQAIIEKLEDYKYGSNYKDESYRNGYKSGVSDAITLIKSSIE